MNATAASLFNTVPPSDALNFYDAQQLNPKRVADFFEFQNGDVARISNVARTSVRFDAHIPQAVLQRLEEIGSIANMVAHALGDDPAKTALWFRTKNPLLGDISPRDMVRFGRYDKLRRFVVSALSDLGRDSAAKARARPPEG